MSTPGGVFRQVALDRLASPEQLDQLMQVTNARGWLALAAVGVMLVAGAAWGVFGSIPESVGGQGILLKSGGLFEVSPLTGGRVTDVAVNVGAAVREGQVVARLAQPDIADRLSAARIELANMRAGDARQTAYGARDGSLQRQALDEQRQGLEQSISADERTGKWLQEKIASQEQLVQQGLLTKTALLSTRQAFDATSSKIATARTELTQITVRVLGLQNQTDAKRRDRWLQLQEQERLVAELERRLKAASEVIAPYTGQILEVMAEPGNVVAPGEPVLTLDLTGRSVNDLEAILYVPSSRGKRIRTGMVVQIAPATVKQEEYGRMIGSVTYVSEFPATSKGMRRVLKNERLVSALSGDDAPYEVHADLVLDPSTVSRYRWSSSHGPPLGIQSGTLATAEITVATERPIGMVLPLFRRWTGL